MQKMHEIHPLFDCHMAVMLLSQNTSVLDKKRMKIIYPYQQRFEFNEH